MEKVLQKYNIGDFIFTPEYGVNVVEEVKENSIIICINNVMNFKVELTFNEVKLATRSDFNKIFYDEKNDKHTLLVTEDYEGSLSIFVDDELSAELWIHDEEKISLLFNNLDIIVCPKTITE